MSCKREVKREEGERNSTLTTLSCMFFPPKEKERVISYATRLTFHSQSILHFIYHSIILLVSQTLCIKNSPFITFYSQTQEREGERTGDKRKAFKETKLTKNRKNKGKKKEENECKRKKNSPDAESIAVRTA